MKAKLKEVEISRSASTPLLVTDAGASISTHSDGGGYDSNSEAMIAGVVDIRRSAESLAIDSVSEHAATGIDNSKTNGMIWPDDLSAIILEMIGTYDTTDMLKLMLRKPLVRFQIRFCCVFLWIYTVCRLLFNLLISGIIFYWIVDYFVNNKSDMNRATVLWYALSYHPSIKVGLTLCTCHYVNLLKRMPDTWKKYFTPYAFESIYGLSKGLEIMLFMLYFMIGFWSTYLGSILFPVFLCIFFCSFLYLSEMSEVALKSA